MSRETQAKNAVIDAYSTLVISHGGWVGLARLRDHLGRRFSRGEVDAALATLAVDGRIRLIMEVNQKTLTQADRAAALHFAGDQKHLYKVNN